MSTVLIWTGIIILYFWSSFIRDEQRREVIRDEIKKSQQKS